VTVPLGCVEFGGPDLPPRRLRNLLQEQIDASPPGSRIDWATYYFRDRELAAALIRASDRGVRVTLVLQWRPRRSDANQRVISLLAEHGIVGGLHRYYPERADGYLHAKVYAFSHPDIAWIGSFNPSGDEPEDPEVVADIGDQDRGDNLLLDVERPRLTAALRNYVAALSRPPSVPLEWRPSSYLPVTDGDTSLYLFPRQRTRIVESSVRRMARGDRLRGAISHMRKSPFTKAVRVAAERGAQVELLVHDTERRVPTKIVKNLTAAGVSIRRIHHRDDLPMHAKFLLLERMGRTEAYLGSYNYNERSRLQNAEVLLRTTDAMICDSLRTRFDKIGQVARD
jgi:phosphatidylserine/phosphatidylglycerophosphate/cardiolipin synthase-like enzyme